LERAGRAGMQITSFYAALFGLLFVALSVRTLRLRGKLRIPVGDAGNQQMLRGIRVHANFAEYVPLALLLIYFTEIQGASARFIQIVCLCLLAGRLSHAYGVSQMKEKLYFRIFGMTLTLGVIIVVSIRLLFSYARSRGV
jgi:uncharacterized membrane protein YecN with MAPEG domain